MKSDHRRLLPELYRPSRSSFSSVDVPPLHFLIADGSGDPNTSPEYAGTVEALFSVAFAAKFIVKRRTGGTDLSVMPLEGLWWGDDMERFSVERKGEWRWRMMIMQPAPVDAGVIAEAVASVRRKKELSALARLRFERFEEGRCVQMVHCGPYADEAENIARLHGHIRSLGLRLRGKHHEIYLNDPRRTAPARLRTILRQPID